MELGFMFLLSSLYMTAYLQFCSKLRGYSFWASKIQSVAELPSGLFVSAGKLTLYRMRDPLKLQFRWLYIKIDPSLFYVSAEAF